MNSIKEAGEIFKHNPLLNFLGRPFQWYGHNRVKRKLVNVIILISLIAYLVVGAYYSPAKQRYSADKLETKQAFGNGTGEMTLSSQIYDAKKGVIALQFETSDSTSDVDLGINPSRLTWDLFAKNPSDKMKMSVIPIIDNKISVIITNVPKNFEAIAIDVTTDMVDTSSLDIDVESSSDIQKSSLQKSDSDADRTVEFYIVGQNTKLKKGPIKSTSREAFTLSELNKEVRFQKSQSKKLAKSIETLNQSISDDAGRIDQLKNEAKYLSGDDLESNQTDIQTIQNDIDSKTEDIRKANDSITSINGKLKSLQEKKKAVRDGTFEFSSAVQTVKLK